MEIKKIIETIQSFVIKRVIEINGILISVLGLLLFLALLSYSPEDPNFIFPDNTKIKNLLGFYGSYTSDLFLQSVGLIAYLVPITLIFNGINIFIQKKFFLIIQNLFFIITYLIAGSLFLSYFYTDTFSLYINGNGGFVGNYLNEKIFNNLILINEIIFYYFLIILTLILFFISINLRYINLISFINYSKKIILKNNQKNYTNKNEVISEYIPQEQIKNLIQEDLPFIKAEQNYQVKKSKFELPSIDLLRLPSKKERENESKNEKNNS